MKVISNDFGGKLNFSGGAVTVTTPHALSTFYQGAFSVTVIDREAHRSVGKAIVGGVALGLVTGGLGAIIGAGLGGKRRGGNIFVITVPGVGSMAVTEVPPKYEALLMIAAIAPITPITPPIKQIKQKTVPPMKQIEPKKSENKDIHVTKPTNVYMMPADIDNDLSKGLPSKWWTFDKVKPS